MPVTFNSKRSITTGHSNAIHANGVALANKT